MNPFIETDAQAVFADGQAPVLVQLQQLVLLQLLVLELSGSIWSSESTA
nr:hypothetical protein [Amycolatopsis circi]